MSIIEFLGLQLEIVEKGDQAQTLEIRFKHKWMQQKPNTQEIRDLSCSLTRR